MHRDHTEPPARTPGQSSTVRMRATYAEVDRMGLLHHANHVRWFERAREEFARRRAAEYRVLEDAGVFLVVVDMEVHYKSPLRYDEEADVTVTVEAIGAASLTFAYVVRHAERPDAVVAIGRSRHAFVDRDARVLRIRDEVLRAVTAPEHVHRRGEVSAP